MSATQRKISFLKLKGKVYQISDPTAEGSSHTHANKAVLDGISSEDVSSWDSAATNSHTHSNKTDLDNITNADMQNWDSAYLAKHEHDNKGVLDAIDSYDVDSWDSAAEDAHTHSNKGVLDDVTSVKMQGWDTAALAAHSHSNKEELDTITDNNLANWDEAYVLSHTHNNSSVLDGITSRKVSSWDSAAEDAHTHDNKSLLDTYTQTEADLASAVDNKHGHSNKSVLDDLSIATASEVSNLYASDTKKFIVFSNIRTLVTQLIAHVNSWGAELRTLINAKVSSVKVDSTSVVSSNVATINTINANYNASTNKLATASDIAGCEVTANKVTSFSASSTDTQYPSAKAVYTETRKLENGLGADFDSTKTYKAGDYCIHDGCLYKCIVIGTLPAGEWDSDYWVLTDISTDVKGLDTYYGQITNELYDDVDDLDERVSNVESRGRYLSQWNCATGQPATQPSSLPYTYKSGDYFIVGTVASGNYTHHITVQGTSSQGLHEGTNTYNVTFDLVNQTATAYATLASIVAAMEEDVKYAATGTVVNTTEGTINIVKVIKWLSGIGFVQADEQKACITDSEPTSITDTVSGGSSTNYKPNGSSYTGTASATVESASVSVEDTYYYDGTTWRLQQNTQKTVSFANLAGQPSDNTALNTALNAKISTSEKGAASGVATLGTDGKVPSAQLPSLDYLPLAGGIMDSGATINFGNNDAHLTYLGNLTPGGKTFEIYSAGRVLVSSDLDVDGDIYQNGTKLDDTYESLDYSVWHQKDTAVGSTTTPVYIASNGAATPLSYTIGKSVPADAVFTDTTYSNATQSADGLMSSSDKTKLDDLSIATASEVSNLYSSDTKKFVILSNVQTLVTSLGTMINGLCQELKTLINAKVSNVKVDNTSVVSSNVATINTINANYNASTNKFATANDISGFIAQTTADGRYLGISAKAASATTADSATSATSANYANSAGNIEGAKIVSPILAGTVALHNIEGETQLDLSIAKCICTHEQSSIGYSCHFTLYCVYDSDNSLITFTNLESYFDTLMDSNQCAVAGSYCAHCINDSGSNHESAIYNYNGQNLETMQGTSFFKMIYRLPHADSALGVDVVSPIVIDIYCELEDLPDIDNQAVYFDIYHGNTYVPTV